MKKSWIISTIFLLFKFGSFLQVQCMDLQKTTKCLTHLMISPDFVDLRLKNYSYSRAVGFSRLWLFTKSRQWTDWHRFSDMHVSQKSGLPVKNYTNASLSVVSTQEQFYLYLCVIIYDLLDEYSVEIDRQRLQNVHFRGLCINKGNELQKKTAKGIAKLCMTFTDRACCPLTDGDYAETNNFRETSRVHSLVNYESIFADFGNYPLMDMINTDFFVQHYFSSFERRFIYHDSENAVLLSICGSDVSQKAVETISVIISVFPNCQKPMKKNRTMCLSLKNAEDEDRTSVVVISDIISISVYKQHSVEQLKTNVHFMFSLVFPERTKRGTQCVFWNRALHIWSREGCYTVSSNLSHVHCHCDHLSSFAVLVHLVRTSNEKDDEAQTVLTYIGCLLSIVCFSLICLTFTFFKSLKTTRTELHRNLAACLLTGTVFFLLRTVVKTSPPGCIIAAVGTHFLYLVSFCWMQVEGVTLILLFCWPKSCRNKNWANNKFQVTLGCILIPVAIIVLAVASSPDSCYDDECWLREDNGCIWSFVFPVIFVTFINSGAFCCTVYTMVKHTLASKVMRKRGMAYNIMLWLKGSILLINVLGIPWAIGVFDIGSNTTVFSYLFILFNSTQGIVMFVFYCVSSSKIRNMYIRFLLKPKCWPKFVRSHLMEMEKTSSNSLNMRISRQVYNPSAYKIKHNEVEDFDLLFSEFYNIGHEYSNHEESSSTSSSESSSTSEDEESVVEPSSLPVIAECKKSTLWGKWISFYRKKPGLPTLSLTVAPSSGIERENGGETISKVIDFAFNHDASFREIENNSGSLFSVAFTRSLERQASETSLFPDVISLKRKSEEILRKTSILRPEKSLSITNKESPAIEAGHGKQKEERPTTTQKALNFAKGLKMKLKKHRSKKKKKKTGDHKKKRKHSAKHKKRKGNKEMLKAGEKESQMSDSKPENIEIAVPTPSRSTLKMLALNAAPFTINASFDLSLQDTTSLLFSPHHHTSSSSHSIQNLQQENVETISPLSTLQNQLKHLAKNSVTENAVLNTPMVTTGCFQTDRRPSAESVGQDQGNLLALTIPFTKTDNLDAHTIEINDVRNFTPPNPTPSSSKQTSSSDNTEGLFKSLSIPLPEGTTYVQGYDGGMTSFLKYSVEQLTSEPSFLDEESVMNISQIQADSLSEHSAEEALACSMNSSPIIPAQKAVDGVKGMDKKLEPIIKEEMSLLNIFMGTPSVQIKHKKHKSKTDSEGRLKKKKAKTKRKLTCIPENFGKMTDDFS